MTENNIDSIKECTELAACSFKNWYKLFKKISITSKCLSIPSNVKDYLLDDIIILPKECETISYSNNDDDDYYDDDDTEDIEQPEFSNFSALITNVITEFNGSIFLKTNWHCPKDAFWITAGQTLQCKDITDVYQLLKASMICRSDIEFHGLSLQIQNDVNHLYDTNQYLIMKKYININPCTEFRCFVRNHQLIAISPRDWPQYHAYIKNEKLDIISDIRTLFMEHIKDHFPLDNYVFDVIRPKKDHVKLMDFSPFGEKWCESLAYEWNDLINDNAMLTNDDDPEFRYVNEECGIQPTKKLKYGLPTDVIFMFHKMQTNNISSDGENSAFAMDNSNLSEALMNISLENE